MQLTDEQKAIIGAQGRVICVNAFAGTGKSTTMRAYASAHPKERILYLAFNKSVALEARQKMPSNVFATTAHGLAYSAIGKAYKHKLADDMKPGELLERKWIEVPPGYSNTGRFLFAQGVLRMLNHFLQNDIESFDDMDPIHLKERAPGNLSILPFSRMIEQAQRLWVAMCDPTSDVPILHDGYMKLYSLTRPNLGDDFDTIQVDEAQDSNPVLLNILKHQDKPRIMLIGDRHQQIYSFRNAVNAMAEMNPDTEYPLTGSFRFGPEVAWRANALLAQWKGEGTEIRGLGKPTKVVDAGWVSVARGSAYIARTNAGIFALAAAAIAKDMRPYFVGGIGGYRFNDFVDAYFFKRGKKPDNPLFAGFQGWGDFMRVAHHTEDPELKGIMGIIFRCESKEIDLPQVVKQIRAGAARRISDADLVLCTAHKSKGLEFPVGCLADDFPSLYEAKANGRLTEDEVNLMYVAITRFTDRAFLPPKVTESIEGLRRGMDGTVDDAMADMRAQAGF